MVYAVVKANLRWSVSRGEGGMRARARPGERGGRRLRRMQVFLGGGGRGRRLTRMQRKEAETQAGQLQTAEPIHSLGPMWSLWTYVVTGDLCGHCGPMWSLWTYVVTGDLCGHWGPVWSLWTHVDTGGTYVDTVCAAGGLDG
eukprot:366128-Chlamydomonas_euryale.AAC.3